MDGTPNQAATISVVTGGLAFVGNGCCCIPIISYLAAVVVPALAVVAIVTGGLGLSAASTGDGEGRGAAMVGMSLGILTLLMDIGMVMALLGAGALFGVAINL